jgi:excisionase family DNA binding protein
VNHLLTTKQLASLLGVSERHIFRQQAAGRLPSPIRIGRCVRWNPDDFQELFNALKNGKPWRPRR